MKRYRHTRYAAACAAGSLLMACGAWGQVAVPTPAVPATAPQAEAAVIAAPATAAAVRAPAGSETLLKGQVLRVKEVELRGTGFKNLAVLLDIGNGHRQIVELGLASNFRSIPVVTGELMVVRGHHSRAGQLDVFVASSVGIGNQDVAIQRETAPAVVAVAAPAGYPVTQDVVKIEGRVDKLRTPLLNGSRQQHVLADIVTRGGQIVVTDLGTPEQIWRADVQVGQSITVRGQEMRVDNRPVLLALEINKNGVPLMVDRHIVRGGATTTPVVPAPAAAVETAAVITRPAVVTPPTTLVPGTTVEPTTPAAVVPARVSPPVPVVP